MKDRVMGLLGVPPGAEPVAPMQAPPDATAQYQSLQVLTLAQRTAEEHLNSARREADRIAGEARDAANQIVRDAQAHAEVMQQEAEKTLSDAHAAAAQTAREAQTHAERARRDAEVIVSDTQLRADEIIKSAQGKADELQHLAQQRYEDVVGGLAARRESLQQQIEALERFDRDYRARLQGFMQSQLRALWADEPRVEPEGHDQPGAAVGTASLPQQRDDSDPYTSEQYAPDQYAPDQYASDQYAEHANSEP
jgi:cell division septum initiation protein DivIVA